MAVSYIALLRKEAGSDYGVEFPDFPGCVTAGKTIDDAARMATAALELHLKGLVEDGEAIPAPSALDVIFASDWETKGTIPLLVTPREPDEKVLRVNVTFKPPVLKALDGYANEHRLTRAAALETAVRAMAMTADSVPIDSVPTQKPARPRKGARARSAVIRRAKRK